MASTTTSDTIIKMIFTIKDYSDKSLGRDLPMFSLNGKSTTA